MRLLPVSILWILVFAVSAESRAGLAAPDRPVLFANFDNKVVGEPSGIRGATFSEPIYLGDLDASVVEASPGQNVLRVSNDLTSTSARSIRWQPIGDAEINEGEVRISLDLTASALDSFSILVRESTLSGAAFLSLNLVPSGTVIANDATGMISVTANGYAASVPLHIEIIFDMDARTSSLLLDGGTIFSDQAFGIADRGIGAVLVGYGSSSNGSPFDLDNLQMSGPLPFPAPLEAGFEDKTAGLPIGLGGAEVHEPHAKDPGMDAIVMEAAAGVNILDLASTNGAASQILRWQFLDDLEIRSGVFVVDFDARMTTRDRYRLSLREPSTSTQNFMGLQFQADGTMSVTDANGTEFLSGVSYAAAQVYQYRMIFDMDAGIYDIFRDGIPLIRERVHGIDT
ncbi:hypothetical protein, partial [Dokdonella sp.]|uniref:hypothetical protein n=1 Tax=Dokdonella sp. TaxID=2291710 RepID=UPI003C362933